MQSRTTSSDARASASRSASTSLIQGLKVHDEEAWQRLLDLYVPLVFSWCRRAGLQSQDAADVVQEVFQGVLHGDSATLGTSDHRAHDNVKE